MSQQIKLLWKDCKTNEDMLRWLIRNDYLYRFWHEIKILRRGDYHVSLQILQKLDKFVKNEHPKIAAQKAETVKNAIKINVKKSYLCGHKFKVFGGDETYTRCSKTKTIQASDGSLYKEVAIKGDGVQWFWDDKCDSFIPTNEMLIIGVGLR